MTARVTGKRKRRTIVEEEIPDGSTAGTGEEPNDFDVSLEAVEDTETLNQVLEQFGQTQNVLYRVYRVTPSGQSFCYESSTFDESFLQRARGAGEYSVRIFINGRFKRPMKVLVDAPADGEQSSNGNGNGNGNHSAFLEKLLMALLLKENTPQPGMNLKDMTEALANLDGLRGKQESGMEMFLKGATFFKDMAAGGNGDPADWKTELLRMGREALPAITSVVQARAGMPITPTQEQPNGGIPVQTIDPNNLTLEQRNTLLKQGIAFLKQQFLMGVDAESALTFIVANASNPQYSPLIRALLSMQWEELEALDDDLKIGKSFHVQFRTLFDGLRYEFSGEDHMEEHPGGHPGNNADLGNNGDTGTGGKS